MLEESEGRNRQASAAWPITLGVLYLARDIYDVIEVSGLSAQKRLEALRTAWLWETPGPKGLDLACPTYPVTREEIQRLERILEREPLPLGPPRPSSHRRTHKPLA